MEMMGHAFEDKPNGDDPFAEFFEDGFEDGFDYEYDEDDFADGDGEHDEDDFADGFGDEDEFEEDDEFLDEDGEPLDDIHMIEAMGEKNARAVDLDSPEPPKIEERKAVKEEVVKEVIPVKT